jgi:phosphoglycerate dehydrogenase-like enzyme
VPRHKIVIAMTPQLRREFFRAEDRTRLATCGEVAISPSPLDHGTPEAGALLQSAEVLVTGWETAVIDESVLMHAPHLRAVIHTAGSVRTYVTQDVFRHQVRVSSQTAANSEPVAEYTVAMIMLAGKATLRAARLYAKTRAPVDRAAQFPDVGLFGRRVGLIGLSRISRRVISLLRPFDIEVLVHSRHLTPEEATALGVRSVSLKELLSTCEVVSLHSASLPRTRHLLGAGELALLQDGSTFINTARGSIVDQDALIAELATGRIDAILDVADPDVTVPTSPLWDMPNVILTPHFAGAVGNEFQRLGRSAVIDVETFLAGGQMPGEITAEQFENYA